MNLCAILQFLSLLVLFILIPNLSALTELPKLKTLGEVKSCLETINNCTAHCQRKLPNVENWTAIADCYDTEKERVRSCYANNTKRPRNDSAPCWPSNNPPRPSRKSGENIRQSETPAQKLADVRTAVQKCVRECYDRNTYNCRKNCPGKNPYRSKTAKITKGSSNSTNTWATVKKMCSEGSKIRTCLTSALKSQF